jgi:hypothetical protein
MGRAGSGRKTFQVFKTWKVFFLSRIAAFQRYPNPTSGNFILVQKGDRNLGTVKVDVFDMSGKKVLKPFPMGKGREGAKDLPGFQNLEGLFFIPLCSPPAIPEPDQRQLHPRTEGRQEAWHGEG